MGNRNNEEKQQVIFGYLSCPKDASGAFVGALLLCDERTRPLHFSWIQPIRPNPIQRLLYGTTLERHLKQDVIAKKLFAGVSILPTVVFVDTEDLINSREVTALPTAFLKRESGQQREAASLSSLVFDTGGNAEDNEIIGPLISDFAGIVDLVDPFCRLSDALREALKSKGGA